MEGAGGAGAVAAVVAGGGVAGVCAQVAVPHKNNKTTITHQLVLSCCQSLILSSPYDQWL
jgi:hypothetical protein